MTANESIIKYLEEDKVSTEDYFEECYNELKEPNYSEFCRKYLNGTTFEGYSFNSSKVKRSQMTVYLREKYNGWVNSRNA